jgi:hypothetical protein
MGRFLVVVGVFENLSHLTFARVSRPLLLL